MSPLNKCPPVTNRVTRAGTLSVPQVVSVTKRPVTDTWAGPWLRVQALLPMLQLGQGQIQCLFLPLFVILTTRSAIDDLPLDTCSSFVTGVAPCALDRALAMILQRRGQTVRDEPRKNYPHLYAQRRWLGALQSTVQSLRLQVSSISQMSTELNWEVVG